jgi:hypothetical protein
MVVMMQIVDYLPLASEGIEDCLEAVCGAGVIGANPGERWRLSKCAAMGEGVSGRKAERICEGSVGKVTPSWLAEHGRV